MHRHFEHLKDAFLQLAALPAAAHGLRLEVEVAGPGHEQESFDPALRYDVAVVFGRCGGVGLERHYFPPDSFPPGAVVVSLPVMILQSTFVD